LLDSLLQENVHGWRGVLSVFWLCKRVEKGYNFPARLQSYLNRQITVLVLHRVDSNFSPISVLTTKNPLNLTMK